jgi:hypothetical protein
MTGLIWTVYGWAADNGPRLPAMALIMVLLPEA